MCEEDTKPTSEYIYIERDDILKKVMAFGPSGASTVCIFEEVQITNVKIPEPFSSPPTGR